MSRLEPPSNHAIVIFGATGDLARRKLLPALYHLAEAELLPPRLRIIGSSPEPLHTEKFRAFAGEAVEEFSRCAVVDERWRCFSESLSYVPGRFGPNHTEPLRKALLDAEAVLGEHSRRLFYLAVPPAAFPAIVQELGASGLAEGACVILEKPFGTDLESARALNGTLHGVFDEERVFRIDHFLGKETVQNVLALRFANGMFEPVWNRDHIDHVQVDVPEELGIGARAGFYDRTGALRDMVVTHLFQVLAFVAMEPPSSLEPEALINEKVKLFEGMTPLGSDALVRGQYDGYREEPGVAPDSETETLVAGRLLIDNWRWAGVPFYFRSGKRMPQSRRSVTIAFRDPPRQMFEMSDVPTEPFGPDHLTFELGPPEGISVSFLAKVPGPTLELGQAHMAFRYEDSFGGKLVEAYERLLLDAMTGDRTLFTRADGIERLWEVVEPVLLAPPPLEGYAPGSWGPDSIHDLVAPRRWHLPTDHP